MFDFENKIFLSISYIINSKTTQAIIKIKKIQFFNLNHEKFISVYQSQNNNNSLILLFSISFIWESLIKTSKKNEWIMLFPTYNETIQSIEKIYKMNHFNYLFSKFQSLNKYNCLQFFLLL